MVVVVAVESISMPILTSGGNIDEVITIVVATTAAAIGVAVIPYMIVLFGVTIVIGEHDWVSERSRNFPLLANKVCDW